MNMKLNFNKFYQEFLTSLGNVYFKWKLKNSTVWDIKSLTEFKNPKSPGIKPVIG